MFMSDYRLGGMIMKIIKKNLLCIILCNLLILLAFFSANFVIYGSEQAQYTNRYNVVIVADASNSMNYTDSDNLRFEAVHLFTNLLAEQGNMLGSVAFSNDVRASHELIHADDVQMKSEVIGELTSVPADGYTNIGEALGKAVKMIDEDGDENLPSVILFLSDGNTEMPSSDQLDDSLSMKSQAVKQARDLGINIYSVCLNADHNADVTEMKQISDATKGFFKEINDVNDLYETFNEFYTLIYGSSSVELLNKNFPSDGVLEEKFQLPEFGIEEVNIIIYGKTNGVSLIKPDGTEATTNVVQEKTFTLLKSSEIDAGEWTLKTTGNTNDNIKVHLVYNNNLSLLIQKDPDKNDLYPGDQLEFQAILTSGGVSATKIGQYTGYSAELKITDVNQIVVDQIPMEVFEDGFKVSHSFKEGTYFYSVILKGNNIVKEIEGTEPIIVSLDNNTPPIAKEEEINEKVYKWPFKDATLSIDLATLTTDKEDEQLTYSVVSSSFLENEDYQLTDTELTMDHFSLWQGDFIIRAVDSGGLYTDIKINVTTIHIGWLAFFAILIAGIIALILFLILLYIALKKPFRGEIAVDSRIEGGTFRSDKIEPRRGRLKLSHFNIDNIGFNYDKSYFQATGKRYIELKTSTPVYYQGRKTNTIHIESGIATQISTDEKASKILIIHFQSHIEVSGRTKRRR